MRGPLFLFFVFLLFASGLNAGAQERPAPRISGEFNNLPLLQFLHEIEAQSSYFFYYDSTGLDSIRVNVTVKEQPLDSVLRVAFRNTDLRFAIDAENHVFLTHGYAIQTTIARGLFNQDQTSPDNLTDTLMAFLSGKKKLSGNSSESRLYEVGSRSGKQTSGSAIVTGMVRNAKNGEPIINAVVTDEQSQQSVVTDKYGNYSLKLPVGNHALLVQSVGMKDSRFQIMVYTDGRLDFDLSNKVETLKEVVVSSKRNSRVYMPQLGVERLSIATIKNVPTVFGETDVLRVITTLPGVKTVGEASTGFNVRGGSVDQNLILLNGMTIYNPSHFFGMFSAFNPDVIKDMALYKGSIPAPYGGRLASVLDITTKEGSKKVYSGSAGIGLITSRLNLEGPIKKDKTSFVFGARSTYANWLLKLLPPQYRDSRASFYDANLGISHQLNAKDNLYLSGYISSDHYNLVSDTTYNYTNRNASIKWKHMFNNRLTGALTLGYDLYKYQISSEKNKVNAYRLAFDVNQLDLKTDFTYFVNAKHSLDFGAGTIRYKLHPGSFEPVNGSQVVPDVVPAEQAEESAAYVADRFTVSPKFSINAGIRYSVYNYLGPQQVNLYAKGFPRDENSQTGTKTYDKGIINTYHGPEYRLAMTYTFTPNFSMKAGYNTAYQYIHLLSNTAAIAPTDIWKLSDPNIKPQKGNQVSIGFYNNLKTKSIETSVEFYYKQIKDYLDYKSGATLVLNHHIETDVMSTRGKAYGAELLVKKTEGKLNGWISYTYSRIQLKMDDSTQGTPVNGGRYYPASYDIPHSATAVVNFRINHRFSLSSNVTYATGRPITLPIGRYYYAGSERVLYGDRNAARIPDYFRADFAMNVDGNYKVHQKKHISWTLGVYNLTGQKNPYSVYFTSEAGRINGYRLAIFGSAIPFINFNVRF
jgi:hypothetical protein